MDRPTLAKKSRRYTNETYSLASMPGFRIWGGMEMRIWLRFKESREQLYRGIHWDDYPEFDAVVDYNVIDSSNGDSVLGFRVCWGRP